MCVTETKRGGMLSDCLNRYICCRNIITYTANTEAFI